MLLVLLLSSPLVVSCTTPPDVVACTELEKDKLGWCTFTISDKEIYVDNDKQLIKDTDENGKTVFKTWSELKRDSLIVPATSQAAIGAYIITNCKQNKQCKNEIGRWSKKIDTAQQKAKTKGKK